MGNKKGFVGLMLLMGLLVMSIALVYFMNISSSVNQTYNMKNVQSFLDNAKMAKRAMIMDYFNPSSDNGTSTDSSSSSGSTATNLLASASTSRSISNGNGSNGNGSVAGKVMGKVIKMGKNTIPGVHSGKLFVPPSDREGMPEKITPIIGKDGWKGNVKYYSWDLESQSPPDPGLVVRFVSPGADGRLETTKDDKKCKGDDICYDIYNDQLDNLYSEVFKNSYSYGSNNNQVANTNNVENAVKCTVSYLEPSCSPFDTSKPTVPVKSIKTYGFTYGYYSVSKHKSGLLYYDNISSKPHYVYTGDRSYGIFSEFKDGKTYVGLGFNGRAIPFDNNSTVYESGETYSTYTGYWPEYCSSGFCDSGYCRNYTNIILEISNGKFRVGVKHYWNGGGSEGNYGYYFNQTGSLVWGKWVGLKENGSSCATSSTRCSCYAYRYGARKDCYSHSSASVCINSKDGFLSVSMNGKESGKVPLGKNFYVVSCPNGYSPYGDGNTVQGCSIAKMNDTIHYVEIPQHCGFWYQGKWQFVNPLHNIVCVNVNNSRKGLHFALDFANGKFKFWSGSGFKSSYWYVGGAVYKPSYFNKIQGSPVTLGIQCSGKYCVEMNLPRARMGVKQSDGTIKWDKWIYIDNNLFDQMPQTSLYLASMRGMLYFTGDPKSQSNCYGGNSYIYYAWNRGWYNAAWRSPYCGYSVRKLPYNYGVLPLSGRGLCWSTNPQVCTEYGVTFLDNGTMKSVCYKYEPNQYFMPVKIPVYGKSSPSWYTGSFIPPGHYLGNSNYLTSYAVLAPKCPAGSIGPYWGKCIKISCPLGSQYQCIPDANTGNYYCGKVTYATTGDSTDDSSDSSSDGGQ